MSDSNKAEIEAVLEAVKDGHFQKDAEAIGMQYTPDALIFDLSPPLGHPLDVPGLAAWLEGWGGSVNQEFRDLQVAVNGDLAFCYGYCKVSTVSKPGGEAIEWWQRLTVCLRRAGGAWKIIHEHTSVPFYMDGSYRAAIDLKP